MPYFISGYVTQDNPESKKYTAIDSSSMTVPDQSMSIQEIMYRASHGLPTTGAGYGLYDDENEDAQPNDFDLTDLPSVNFDENDARKGVTLGNYRQTTIIETLRNSSNNGDNQEPQTPVESVQPSTDVDTDSSS